MTEAPICDMCHAPDAVLYKHHLSVSPIYLCPACLVRQAHSDAAFNHLAALLESAVTDWLTVWQGEGVKLYDYPSLIADLIEEKHRAGLLVARPVKASTPAPTLPASSLPTA